MAKQYDNYAAVAASTTLLNNLSNSDQAEAITGAADGQATVSSSNGTFATTSDQQALTGTGQGTSGTSYIAETIPATTTLSFSIWFTIPTGGLAIGAGTAWFGVGGTRSCAFSLLSTEQFRFFNASGGTLFTSTVSGGFTPGTEYRVDAHLTVDTATTGRLVCKGYTSAGTSEISGTSYDSGATVNLGTAGITQVRRGTRTGTGTADDNVRVAFGYDPASAYLMGPKAADPPTIDLDRPAPNIVDLRASTIGDDSEVLNFPTPVKVSGPTLPWTELANGLWLTEQDDGDTASVYTFIVEQDDEQTAQEDTTIDPLEFTSINVAAPLRPVAAPPNNVWG